MANLALGSSGVVAFIAALTGEPALPRAAPVAAMAFTDVNPSTRIGRSRDGLFYLTAHVNGRSVRFLVDTGASVTMLTPSDARHLGVVFTGHETGLRTASGHGTMRWAALEQLDVGGQKLQGLDVAVGPHNLPVSLLGQNVLIRLGTISIAGNELLLS